MQDLRITPIQAPLVWEDRAANLSYFTERLAPLAGQTDLVILPEMFTTGFTMNPGPHAEDMAGPTMEWLAQTAARLRAAIAGSLIIRENGRHYNRFVFMRSSGEYDTYDKRYPFTLSGEHEHYARGDKRVVIDYRGWRIRPLICYDLRFPVWSANAAENPYDLLIYVASWPNKRAYDWRTLLRARAIENQAYVVGVNRLGTDAYGLTYAGDSCVIDPGPDRDWLDLASDEEIKTASLSYDRLMALRRQLPFLQDGDPFHVDH